MDQLVIAQVLQHESKGKYTNGHLLHVECGVALESQIRTAFKRAITEAENRLNKKFNCSFRISLVANRYGKSFGYAYVWVTNTEVFNILTGKNPDGSDRVELIRDPTWRPPTKEDIDAFNKRPVMNWGDELEEEENLTTPRMIRQQLDPIVKLDPYELSDLQRKVPGFERCEFGTFKVTPTAVSDSDPEFIENVICASKVPPEITEDDLKEQFKHYVSDPRKGANRKGGGLELYPLVKINHNRTAFITFDQATHDAQFALKISKKVEVKKGDRVITIVFNKAYKNTNSRKPGPSK